MRRNSLRNFEYANKQRPPVSKTIACDQAACNRHHAAMKRWLLAAAFLFISAVIIQTAKAEPPSATIGKARSLLPYHSAVHPQLSKIDRRLAFNTRNLGTSELLAVAEFQRHNHGLSPQIVLNHQWLYEQQTGDTVEGKKVFTSMLSSGLKLYWNELRASQFQSQYYLPDADGHGQLNDYWDYKIRLSPSRFRLVISHEF